MNKNSEVTLFLDGLNHPYRNEIEVLRELLLTTVKDLEESIKWNGPNYTFHGEDRITMRILPPKQVQLIFHRGAKKLEQPSQRLIQDKEGLLQWKENDRAVATFKSLADIENRRAELVLIISDWIEATK